MKWNLFGKRTKVQKEYQSLVAEEARLGIPKELFDEYEHFFCENLGGKIIDGINFALVSAKEEDRMARYKEILAMTESYGYKEQNYFTAREICEGCIFALDERIAQPIFEALWAQIGADEPAGCVAEFIKERKGRDISRMAEYILPEFAAGNRELAVAMYSLAPTFEISFVAEGKDDGKKYLVKYPSFMLQVEDLADVNERLMRNGCKIESVTVQEILPSNTKAALTYLFLNEFK